MHFPNISVDVVKMKLTPFTLNDNVKRWTYGLATNYVSCWDEFATLVFLIPRLLR